MIARGVLARDTSSTTVKILPPLIINEDDIRRGIRLIRLAIKDCEKKGGNMDMEQVRIKRGIIRAYLPPVEKKPKEEG